MPFLHDCKVLFFSEFMDFIPAEFAQDQPAADGGSFCQELIPVFGPFPEILFQEGHCLGVGMCKGCGQSLDGFIHLVNAAMQLGIKASSSCPFGIAPHGCVDGQAGEGGQAYLSFYGGSYYKRPDADGQFAQLDVGAFDGDGVVGCGRKSYSSADTFTVYANDDELRAFAHGINEVGKTAEEL